MMLQRLYIFSSSEEVWMKRLKIVLPVFIFAIAMVVTLTTLTGVLRNKELTSMHENFKQYDKGELDTIFIGSSHQFCTINPSLLYTDYGIEAFMMGTAAQQLTMSYYAAMEAIELQEPEVIVLEAHYAAFEEGAIGIHMNHMFFDGMPFSKTKYLAVKELFPKEEWLYYYLDFFYYHERWKEVGEEDFDTQINDDRGGFYTEEVGWFGEFAIVDEGEKEAMTQTAKEKLDRIIHLCKENEVTLIVYVAPYLPGNYETESLEEVYRQQRVYNWLGDYLAEQEIAFYNLFYEVEEIGLDVTSDFYDPAHLNNVGQEKVTRYMAEKGYIY